MSLPLSSLPLGGQGAVSCLHSFFLVCPSSFSSSTSPEFFLFSRAPDKDLRLSQIIFHCPCVFLVPLRPHETDLKASPKIGRRAGDGQVKDQWVVHREIIRDLGLGTC